MPALAYGLATHLAKFRVDSKTKKEKGGTEARYIVLSYLVLRANIRNRAYPNIDTVAAETGYGRKCVIDALKWLTQRGAIYNVPKQQRVDGERNVHANNAVYQLTGFIELCGEQIRYLHLQEDEQPEKRKPKGSKKQKIGSVNDTDSQNESVRLTTVNQFGKRQEISSVNDSPSLYERNQENDTNKERIPITTIIDVEDHSVATGAIADDVDEIPALSDIEILLSENGITSQSWCYAKSWSADEIRVVIDNAKAQPSLTNPGGWIVTQLKDAKAHEAARRDLELRQNQPVQESAPLTPDELAALSENQPSPIPPVLAFEPIVIGWQKDIPAADTWQHGVLNALQAQVRPATFNSWLKGSRLLAYEGNQPIPTLTIVTSSTNAKEWLQVRLIGTIKGVMSKYFGNATLRIIDPSEIEATLASIRHWQEESRQTALEPDEQREESADLPAPPPQPKPDETQKPDPGTLSPAVIWGKILSGLRHADLNRDQFETYFKTAELIGYLGDEIFVKVGGHTVREVRTNLRSKVTGRIEKVTGGRWRIRLVDRDEADRLPENLIKLQEAV